MQSTYVLIFPRTKTFFKFLVFLFQNFENPRWSFGSPMDFMSFHANKLVGAYELGTGD